jgi:hypothetical protein
MMDVGELFAGLEINRDLVVAFFVVFARFEYALKEAGYVFDQGGRAAPSWKKYNADVAPQFDDASPEELRVIAELLKDPPLYQELTDQGIKWKPMNLDGPPVAQALSAAAQVRHNLFHGGKHTPHSPPERDQRLVALSFALLHACLQRSPDVLAKFDELQRH